MIELFRPCSFILLFVFLPIFSGAQNNNYSLENFFIEEGFPVTRINNINQDKNGIMWFCSEKQIHSFNGSNFKLELEFNNTDFSPNVILFDNRGNKWLFQLKQRSSTSYHSIITNMKIFDEKNQELDIDKYTGIENLLVEKFIQNKDGIIYLKFEDQFYAFDKEPIKLNLPETTKSLIFINDKYAIINKEKGGCAIDVNSNKVIYEFPNALIYKARTNKEKIYLRYSNGELHSFIPESKEFKLISKSVLRITDNFSDYRFDQSGEMWIIRLRSLSTFDMKTEREINFTNNQSYPFRPYNTTSFIDREGNIWIGTNLGVNKITEHHNKLFQRSSPFNYSTRTLEQLDENELFVSTYSGSFIYNLKTQKSKKISDTEVIFEMIKEGENYYTIDRDNLLVKKTLDPNRVLKSKLFEREYNNGQHPGSILKHSNGQKLLSEVANY